jgi:hypothetical protein
MLIILSTFDAIVIVTYNYNFFFYLTKNSNSISINNCTTLEGIARFIFWTPLIILINQELEPIGLFGFGCSINFLRVPV